MTTVIRTASVGKMTTNQVRPLRVPRARIPQALFPPRNPLTVWSLQSCSFGGLIPTLSFNTFFADSTKNLINTLFRLNSVASKVMKYFSKIVGSVYMVRVLGPIITELCSLDDAMEVDPSRKKDQEDVDINKKKLMAVCQKILTAILTSAKYMPSEMIVMCRHLYLEVEKTYPGNGPRQVGGFLFLRFFCPAIVTPNSQGVVAPDFNITENSKRCLLLITKVLQNLSNGILFGTKELYMGGTLNDFISSNIPVLNKFFASFVVGFIFVLFCFSRRF